MMPQNYINTNIINISAIILLLVITLYMFKKARGLSDSNNNTNFLLWSAILVFLIQMISTFNWINLSPQINNLIKNLKNIFSIASNIIPIVCSLWMCNNYWKAMERDVKAGKVGDSIYPTQMVAQGTFYTFVGVSAILMGYNADGSDIDLLISGLKLAFITSVIGLIYSVAAKNYLKRKTEEWENSHLSNPQYLTDVNFFNVLIDISNTLKNGFETIIKNQTQQKNILKDFCESMESDNDKIIKNQADQTKNLSIFLNDSISKNNDILKDSLCSVNNMMISNLNKTFEIIKNNVDSASVSMAKISETSEKINKDLININRNINNTKDKMADYDEIYEQYITKIKEVNNQIVIISDNLSKISISEEINSINALIADLKVKIDNFTLSVSNLRSSASYLLEGFKDEREKLSNDLELSIDSLENSFSNCIKEINDSLKENINDLNTNVKSNIQNINATIINEKDLIEIQLEKFKEFKIVIENVARDINNQDESIKIAGEKIVDQYSSLREQLLEKHAQYDKMLITAQEKYQENLNKQIYEIANIMGDIIKKVYKDYNDKINQLQNEINNIIKDSREEIK